MFNKCDTQSSREKINSLRPLLETDSPVLDVSGKEAINLDKLAMLLRDKVEEYIKSANPEEEEDSTS